MDTVNAKVMGDYLLAYQQTLSKFVAELLFALLNE
jgi:hypothetical protein